MSETITMHELKTMIATKIKEIGLNDILDNTFIDKIKNNVMKVYNHEQAIEKLPQMIPESSTPDITLSNTENNLENSTDTTIAGIEKNIDSDFTQQPGQNIDMGTSGNIPGYVPELPGFLNNIEPAKIIVFSQNEISEGGENLSNKPLRTYEDPDVKKSMNDFWADKGQRKADVYMAKLEKIGELEFNYANGTTQFVEKRFDPDFAAQAKYKENPYMDKVGPAAPGTLDMSGQPNILNQIASSVDLEKIVKDLVMGILRDQLLTNTEKAANATAEFDVSQAGLGARNPANPQWDRPTDNGGRFISESFSLKMIDLVNTYDKVDSPVQLKEAIEKNDKTFLVNENTEVQEWVLDGKSYFTPVNKISNRKCYIK